MTADNDTLPLPLLQPTPLQRRLIDAAVEIEDCTPDTVEFLHSVLCQVGLPRRSTDQRSFERGNGRATICIEAGRLQKAGKLVEMRACRKVFPTSVRAAWDGSMAQLMVIGLGFQTSVFDL